MASPSSAPRPAPPLTPKGPKRGVTTPAPRPTGPGPRGWRGVVTKYWKRWPRSAVTHKTGRGDPNGPPAHPRAHPSHRCVPFDGLLPRAGPRHVNHLASMFLLLSCAAPSFVLRLRDGLPADRYGRRIASRPAGAIQCRRGGRAGATGRRLVALRGAPWLAAKPRSVRIEKRKATLSQNDANATTTRTISGPNNARHFLSRPTHRVCHYIFLWKLEFLRKSSSTV